MVPARPVAAHIHSRRNRISPAYMLPNSRSECDSGLDRYSTQLKRKFAGQSSGLEPNGRAEQLVDEAAHALGRDREADHQHPDRKREREGRVYVGGRHDAEAVLARCRWVTSATQSAGRKSIEFISTTQTNTVSASGATKRLRSP